MSRNYIEEANLSTAWLKALRTAGARGSTEVAPLIVSVTGFSDDGTVAEDPTVRGLLDGVLCRSGLQSVETVAGTIFPFSFWNRSAPRSVLFDRYRRLAGRIKKASTKNRRGVYFDRMITGGPPSNANQLDFIIDSFTSTPGFRRSVLQVGIFDPHRDHTGARRLGFPCLQHVTFAPTPEGLSVSAFYAHHYLVQRGYGNYLGLCRLGQFVAHELQMPLARMTCYAGIAECDLSKAKVRDLLDYTPDDEEDTGDLEVGDDV